VATFLTMSYILFVNPAILSAAGMPFEAVATATAIAAAVATLAMGLFANLPFALAPGLGINAVVAFDVILAVATSTVLGLIFGVLDGPDGVTDIPGSDNFSTIGDALDPSNLGDALTVALIPVIFALFMTDFFDTIGTAVAIGSSAGLVDERGELENTDRLLIVDSGAAAFGGAMGSSSVTTYVESGAGVAEGARTGLSSLVVAGLFVLAIFFIPIMALVGQDVQVGEQTFIHPAIAPALVLVGLLMLRLVEGIDWSLPEHSIPAFLIIAGIPLTFSIAAGIGFGVIGYVVVMAALGRAREVHPLMWGIASFFVLFFAADWLSAHVF
jgi:AGZA family xanthine/uracil permease-like MFS transporter